MRATISVDNNLISEALLVSGLKTKRETAEEGLRLLIAMKKQAKIRQYRGKMLWEGDLEAMRTDS